MQYLWGLIQCSMHARTRVVASHGQIFGACLVPLHAVPGEPEGSIRCRGYALACERLGADDIVPAQLRPIEANQAFDVPIVVAPIAQQHTAISVLLGARGHCVVYATDPQWARNSEHEAVLALTQALALQRDTGRWYFSGVRFDCSAVDASSVMALHLQLACESSAVTTTVHLQQQLLAAKTGGGLGRADEHNLLAELDRAWGQDTETTTLQRQVGSARTLDVSGGVAAMAVAQVCGPQDVHVFGLRALMRLQSTAGEATQVHAFAQGPWAHQEMAQVEVAGLLKQLAMHHV